MDLPLYLLEPLNCVFKLPQIQNAGSYIQFYYKKHGTDV